MDLQIRGRKAIVAGASAGLGKASALALALEGVEVFLSARGERRLLDAANEIANKTRGKVTPVVADHSTRHGRASLLAACPEPDILVMTCTPPKMTEDGKFIYAHRPDLEANWISLDDVAKCMIASLDRPDMEGAWLNIGGPQRLKPTDIAAALSDVIGRPVRYEAVTPRKFGELLTGAFGDDMDATERAATEDYIDAFYQYNNKAPTRPFQVDTDAMLERLPIKLETIREWAARQDWTLSNKPRPPAG